MPCPYFIKKKGTVLFFLKNKKIEPSPFFVLTHKFLHYIIICSKKNSPLFPDALQICFSFSVFWEWECYESIKMEGVRLWMFKTKEA
jgi:hypothetical protein